MADRSSIGRILSLLRVIGDSTKTWDVESLASHFGVSDKTVRRDLKELKDNGIPITETIGPRNHRTYSLNRGQLPPLRLTFDEALAIFLGKASLTAFNGTGIHEAGLTGFEKLRLLLGDTEARYVDKLSSRIHVTSQASNFEDRSDIVDSLLIAIEDNRAIFIEYQSSRSTEPLTYDIFPYGLAEHRESLYVVGHSCHHNEMRTWKIDRIQSTELTTFPFQRPHDFNISAFFEGAFSVVTGAKQENIRVRFTGNAVQYVCEKQFHASQKSHMQSDGSVILEFQLNSLLEVKAWILSFGVKAEVLMPQELRIEIVQELVQMIALYASEKNRHDSSSISSFNTLA